MDNNSKPARITVVVNKDKTARIIGVHEHKKGAISKSSGKAHAADSTTYSMFLDGQAGYTNMILSGLNPRNDLKPGTVVLVKGMRAEPSGYEGNSRLSQISAVLPAQVIPIGITKENGDVQLHAYVDLDMSLVEA